MDAALNLENSGEKSYAGFYQRFAAYLIDCLILFVGLLLLQAALYFVNPLIPIFQSGREPAASQFHLWVFATATIPFLLYFALMLRSARQATLGMRLLKIRVANLAGQPISFSQALLRSAVMLVPFELNHVVMFYLSPRSEGPPSTAFMLGLIVVWAVIAIYIAPVFLTRRRQSVHDLIASTIVRHGS
jgi:uncharacterized RDD family membrane protein YckC